MFDLTGHVAIVSGGSGWLGTAIVRALCSHGARVHAISRDPARARSALTDISGDLHLVEADVTTPAWSEAIGDIADQDGRLDVLVNNAHIGRGGSLRLAEHADFIEALNLAVVAAADGMNAARPGFARAHAAGGTPSVVNIASMYGIVSPDPDIYDAEEDRNPPYYGAAKAALIQLTRYAAAELGPDGIRVNAVAPGPIPAPAAQQDDAFISRLSSRTMLKRIGRPEEVASAVLYLASGASSYVTGAVLPVDGGWTAW